MFYNIFYWGGFGLWLEADAFAPPHNHIFCLHAVLGQGCSAECENCKPILHATYVHMTPIPDRT